MKVAVTYEKETGKVFQHFLELQEAPTKPQNFLQRASLSLTLRLSVTITVCKPAGQSGRCSIAKR